MDFKKKAEYPIYGNPYKRLRDTWPAVQPRGVSRVKFLNNKLSLAEARQRGLADSLKELTYLKGYLEKLEGPIRSVRTNLNKRSNAFSGTGTSYYHLPLHPVAREYLDGLDLPMADRPSNPKRAYDYKPGSWKLNRDKKLCVKRSKRMFAKLFMDAALAQDNLDTAHVGAFELVAVCPFFKDSEYCAFVVGSERSDCIGNRLLYVVVKSNPNDIDSFGLMVDLEFGALNRKSEVKAVNTPSQELLLYSKSGIRDGNFTLMYKMIVNHLFVEDLGHNASTPYRVEESIFTMLSHISPFTQGVKRQREKFKVEKDFEYYIESTKPTKRAA